MIVRERKITWKRKLHLIWVVAFSFSSLALLLFLTDNNVTSNVSAVVPVGVGVYWDSGCTDAVEKIGWGVLSPDSISSVDIHVRNEEEETVLFLFLNTLSWNPPETSLFMTLSWNYDREEIVANDTLLLRLTLSVSSDITGITEFGFYITIFGSFYVPGDIDHNGHVNLDDLFLFGNAWGSTPDSLNWNPDADFDRDNRVGLSDLHLFRLYWCT